MGFEGQKFEAYGRRALPPSWGKIEGKKTRKKRHKEMQLREDGRTKEGSKRLRDGRNERKEKKRKGKNG